MISFIIYDDLRLVYTDQWIIQRRTRAEKDTSRRKAGAWTDWINSSYYMTKRSALRALMREPLRRLDGEYHRDDIDALVAAMSSLESTIEKIGETK